VCDKAQKSGVLSEQIHPYTGEQISATPLIWSHAEFVDTIAELVIKKQELSGSTPQNCKIHKFPKFSI
jgi:GH15 family glucan-1,4-alpha-glucosidase